MRVCIVTPDFVGPITNGGVGTASLGLAEALVGAGHEVSVLYASGGFEQGDLQQWVAHYASRRIEFYSIPNIDEQIYRTREVSRSLRVYKHLKYANYDLVHFPDYGGLGFYTAQAAALGHFSQSTAVVTTLHSPSIWSRSFGCTPVSSVSFLIGDALERGAVEYSDAVISPSRYMLDWATSRGWKLPRSQYHALNALAEAQLAGGSRNSADRLAVPGDGRYEFVFFGRIERRKGFHLFVDAINELIDRGKSDQFEVTFLGKFNEASVSKRTLGLRTRHWPIRWRVIDDFDSQEAVRYLSSASRRVAVMPSLGDNSPCAVVECLENQIPFLGCAVGGVPELVADRDRERVLVKPVAFDLADALDDVLETGLRPANPESDHLKAGSYLAQLHEDIASAKRAQRWTSGVSGKAPIGKGTVQISVCLVHRNRIEFLQQALQGYETQEFRNFEVIIADNGSGRPRAMEFLGRLEADNPHSFPIRILRLGQNRFPEAARNAAATIACGQWLKFHDDDNVAKPTELRLLAAAMRSGRADAVSCSLDVFAGTSPPATDASPLRTIVFLGDAGAASYIENLMGDTNFIVDREVFHAVGGFAEEGLLHAGDWRFLAKLKSRGYRVATIPDALTWYREDPFGPRVNWLRGDHPAARYRALAELGAALGDEVHQLLLLAQSKQG